MAYLIINGKSSNNINGLLIQSLPPITKPKMRTSVEEIDGRDGDIVTKLGYAAYDKTVVIGLKGDYNTDDVIEYLTQDGVITFSNEPDKIYRFSQIEQADFAKLIRFKTANVNFHVQPFKYSGDEPPIHFVNDGKTIGQVNVRNNGNIYSRPRITINGKNLVSVYVNNEQIYAINLSSAGETIIIDSIDMNATDPEGNFLNRKVAGDYDSFIFKPGHNDLIVTGDFSGFTLEYYSRWI